jgi:hypothetical protein
MYCFVACHTRLPATSAIGLFCRERANADAVSKPGAYKGRFAGGLVLDRSLGAGVTDETFLIPSLDVQYLKCLCSRTILLILLYP